MSLLLFAKKKFNPRAWFAKGEPGAWYDPSDLTTLFQDSAGTTPMSAVEQPVGLMLDKSKGLALGAELVTNGTFDTNVTGWGIGGGGSLAWDSGRALVTTGGVAYTGIQQDSYVYVIGKTYKATAYVQAGTYTNRIALGIGGIGWGGGLTNSSGELVYYFTATSTSHYIQIVPYNSTQVGTYWVDNISVKQSAGNHAFQATSGNRPVLSARVNLLTKTEDFSDAVWTKRGICTVTANATTDPLGGNTADLLSNVGASSTDDIYYTPYNNVVVPASVPITLVIFIKKVSTTGTLQIGAPIGLAYGRWNVDLSLLSSGWEKLTATHPAVTVIAPYVGSALGNGIVVYSASAGKLDFYIWGADLRPTNSGALLPAYQRVNTASDYDTVGFPLYLKANGTSSAMSTNSIDFSSTDKMTVVTGVRKLSDATIQIALELSVIADSNNGTFLLAPSYDGITSPGAYWSAASKGSSIARVTSGASYIAPISNINTLIGSISTPYAQLKINGTQVASSTSGQGAGTFGNYPLYLFARAGTSLFLNGQFYGAIIRGAQSDTASVTQTEQYMATKTGITF